MKKKSPYDCYLKLRRSFSAIKPITQVVGNKKAIIPRKKKYKEKYSDYNND